MNKLEKLKISQLKKFLASQVVFRDQTLYYSHNVSLETLTKTLNLDHQKTELIYQKISGSKERIKNTILNENIMQNLLLELGFDFEKKEFKHFYEQVQFFGFAQKETKFINRSLIVTVMGHVDHGKTTLLDVIRNTDVAHREHGKITQKIGGYEVNFKKNKITFIDTPGHEIFQDMRSQGAQITDLIVLVVAGNEGIKPQTIEAIQHAKRTKVPIIVFINKMDLATANPQNIMQQLSHYDLISTAIGGNTVYKMGSCLQKKGIQELLNAIVLKGNEINLKTDINLLPKALVIDSFLDKQGVKTSVIIQNGNLKVKEAVIVDDIVGKIKSIDDDLKTCFQIVTPGKCVVLLGLNKLVPVGSIIFGFPNDKLVANLAKNFNYEKSTTTNKSKQVLLNSVKNFLQATKQKQQINLIVKVDSKSSEQVLKKRLSGFLVSETDSELIELNFIQISFGEINLNDLQSAIITKSQILTFNVKLNKVIGKKIEALGIIYHNFYLLYKFFEYLEDLQTSVKNQQLNEKIVGQAEVLKVFHHSKLGSIAGCIIRKGQIKLDNNKIQVMRQQTIIGKNLKIKSLKHERDNIQGAVMNQEFGIILFNFDDFQVGDELCQFQVLSQDEK